MCVPKKDQMQEDTIKQLTQTCEAQATKINDLIEALDQSGIKTKLQYDVYGRPFDLPVDQNHKATRIKLFSTQLPHMRQFHASWFGFFTAFAGTFAAAPLMPYIRADLSMTKAQVGLAGVASISGGILGRLTMGGICDKIGPRYGMSILLSLCSIFCFCMLGVSNAGGLIALRCLIGVSLATFVACQYWTSRMFAPEIVGLANATTAGWGNAGGGFTQLIMPLVFLAIRAIGDLNDSQAWRFAYIVPGCVMFLAAFVVLTAQDLPDGNYAELELSGHKKQTQAASVAKIGFSNLNAWWAHICYAMCFGVELTMNNIAALYFYDRFDMPVAVAGLLASLFGMMNLFARSWGGLISDKMNTKFGMRGRLWWMWASISCGGVFCMLMAAQNSVGKAVLMMICFSISVQAAEGACFGVVPSINPGALGVISGIVGAGGNVGSAFLQIVYFRGAFSTQDGIMYMGVTIVLCALTCIFIYFPDKGSMLLPAGALGSFDPQIVKGTGDVGISMTSTKTDAKTEVPNSQV